MKKSYAVQLIRKQAGMIKTSEAIRAGVNSKTLYSLRDQGILELVSRGLFRLTELAPLSNLDLVTVARRVPRGVVCLISALAYHEITTQIPHSVSFALEKGAETPRIGHPPVTVHRFSTTSLNAGIKTYYSDDIPIRIYNPEKTLADCFKFRNKIGMDVVLESMRLYREHKRIDRNALLKYARICRVEKLMTPYLEAMF